MCKGNKKCKPCSLKENISPKTLAVCQKLMLVFDENNIEYQKINNGKIHAGKFEIIADYDGTYILVNPVNNKKKQVSLDQIKKLYKIVSSIKENLESPDGLQSVDNVVTDQPLFPTQIPRIMPTATIKEASATLDSKKAQYAQIKDLDVTRPRMAPKPGVTNSRAVKDCGLYIQDEASYIIIDKYGFDKGYKAWEYTIGQGGAMYQASTNIVNEKWTMCEKLGLTKQLVNDYFFRSYFDIWKEWSGKGDQIFKSKHNVKTQTLNVPSSLTAKKQQIAANPTPVVKTSKFDQLKASIVPEPKDEMRVRNILSSDNPYAQAKKMVNATNDIKKLIGRGKELENQNSSTYLGLSNLFFNKAKQMMGESVAKRLSEIGKQALKEGNSELAIKCLTKAKAILKENTQDIRSSKLIMTRLENDLTILNNLKAPSAWSADVKETMDTMISSFVKLKTLIKNDSEMRNN